MRDNKQQLHSFQSSEYALLHLLSPAYGFGQTIYLALLGMVIAGMVAINLIETNVVILGQGVIVSRQPNNAVTSSVAGQVAEVRIQENSFVTRGDTLARLTSKHLRQKIISNNEQLKKEQDFVKDLQTLLGDSCVSPEKLSTDLYRYEWMKTRRELAEQNLIVLQQQQELHSAKLLFRAGALAGLELDKKRYDWKYAVAQQALRNDQRHHKWEAELQKYLDHGRQLLTENRELNMQLDRHVILASVSGTILGYSGVSTGNFIVPNQPLAYISPEKELQVKVRVPSGAIGLIAPGMAVRFQIHAFDFHRWGLAGGRVVSVAGDASEADGRSVFMVTCQLDDRCLRLKNGFEGQLKKGMSLTARFLVARRTLFQLLYDQLDQWVNPHLL